MTHQFRKASRPRASDKTPTPAPLTFAASPPLVVCPARAPTTLAISMMVALRYLEGRAKLSPGSASRGCPDQAVS